MIFASSAVVGTAIIALLAFAAHGIIERTYRANVERLLANSADFVAAAIEQNMPPEKLAEICLRNDRNAGIRTTVIDRDGEIAADSRADKHTMSNHLNRTEIKKALDGEKNFSAHYSGTLGARMLYIAVPAGKKTDGGYEYCVRQSVSMKSLGETKRLFTFEIIALAAAAILLSAHFSYRLARRISEPLKKLAEASAECAGGNFDSPIPESKIREIGELGSTLSAMSKTLKKRVNSLRKRNCELDEIFEYMTDCVFICSRKGTLKNYNKACAKLFGLPEEAEKIGIAEAFRNSEVLAAIDETFNADGEVLREIEISPERTYALVGVQLPYESATPRALFVMRDVSYAKKNESLRREFVAGVSHELKTPITAIKMAAETLEFTPDDPEAAKRFIAIIEREAERMDTLVNDMLLLSKIEFAKKFDSENFEYFPLRSAIEDAVSAHEEQARDNADSVAVECPEDLEVKGDFRLIQIAVSNLVGNAVKYGGHGAKIKIEAHQGERGGAKITVSDNGAGIPFDDLPHVFERFYRVDKGRSRAQGGTGLGLAIVKHVALLHNGGVGARSELGKGSEFSITIG